MLTAHDVLRVNSSGDSPRPPAFDCVTLAHDERHLRRKRLTLTSGEPLMVDLPQTLHLHHGDRLLLDGEREVEVIAATEELTEIRAHDPKSHAALCWHIGNRHLKAQIEPDRILILRDPVIHTMLEGLGAHLHSVEEPFHPVHGAYHNTSGHTHNHSHSHEHQNDHTHG